MKLIKDTMVHRTIVSLFWRKKKTNQKLLLFSVLCRINLCGCSCLIMINSLTQVVVSASRTFQCLSVSAKTVLKYLRWMIQDLKGQDSSMWFRLNVTNTMQLPANTSQTLLCPRIWSSPRGRRQILQWGHLIKVCKRHRSWRGVKLGLKLFCGFFPPSDSNLQPSPIGLVANYISKVESCNRNLDDSKVTSILRDENPRGTKKNGWQTVICTCKKTKKNNTTLG